MTEEQVFLAALDLPDFASRSSYLDEVCGRDSELRRQVEELLAAHERSGEFLDEPAAGQMAGGQHCLGNETVALTAESDGDAMGADKKSNPSTNPDNHDEDLHFLKPSTRPGAIGRIGHYDVLEVLGKGGFGVVFRAFDDQLQRVVAVKVLAPSMAAASPARKRFLREARSSAQVRHETVVQVYAVEEQPLPYLVMEFIPGETLQQRLDREGPLEAPAIVRIGRQIAEGLAAAHDTGLIHRDIKPSNIMVDGSPQQGVKITDFGLARAADDASLTRSGVVAGTPMFMSPEQAMGDSFDHRADLFSLGSVLYVMCTGRPPFRASTTFAVLKRVAEDEPRPIREVIPEVPEWLCGIVAKLHAKNPDERFQSAREVADVLADCEAQLKAHAKLKDFGRIPRGTSKRTPPNKWRAAVSFGLPLAIFLGVALAVFFGTRDKSGEPSAPPGLPGHLAKTEPPPRAVAPFNAAQARQHQEAWAKHLGVPVEYTNSLGMKFVLIPPGEFMMGTSDRDRRTPDWNIVNAARPSSLPQHPVRITEAYFAGVYEVTVEQFRSYINSTGSATDAESSGLGSVYWDADAGGERRDPKFTWKAPGYAIDAHTPVTCVTWDDANRFCKWLSQKEGRTYRLPTEAEWENSCRAGTVTAFSFGPELGKEQAISDRTPLAGPRPIGSCPGNAFGLHDMHGNVLEWCEDGPRKYTFEAASNPSGPRGDRAVVRGGTYAEAPTRHKWFQSSGRRTELRSSPNVGFGFRIVMVDVLKDTGWVYRLPKEAEWEYACRGGPMADKAGSAFDFYFAKPTNTLFPEQANFEHGNGLKRTCKVGSYEPNVLGLYDLHGNVWEWCEDTEKGADGTSNRVNRGGSGSDDSGDCRAAARLSQKPSSRGSGLGLRLARVPSGAPSPEAKSPSAAITPFTDAAVKRIAALPAEQQIEEVRKELVRRNPGFDGSVEHAIEGGVVIKVGIIVDYVTDISPIRVFDKIHTLDCPGTGRDEVGRGNGKLADLSPLKSMDLSQLRWLNLSRTRVTNEELAPFANCPNLEGLHLSGLRIDDAGTIDGKPAAEFWRDVEAGK